jgi:hypothetical protein
MLDAVRAEEGEARSEGRQRGTQGRGSENSETVRADLLVRVQRSHLQQFLGLRAGEPLSHVRPQGRVVGREEAHVSELRQGAEEAPEETESRGELSMSLAHGEFAAERAQRLPQEQHLRLAEFYWRVRQTLRDRRRDGVRLRSMARRKLLRHSKAVDWRSLKAAPTTLSPRTPVTSSTCRSFGTTFRASQ